MTTAGLAYCWGDNVDGKLGDGTTTDSTVPVAVSGGLTFQSVNAGSTHSCGVTTAGAAYCWGDNREGQLGDGTNTDSTVPVAVSGELTFQSVSPGYTHSCGVTTAGGAYCWGWLNLSSRSWFFTVLRVLISAWVFMGQHPTLAVLVALAVLLSVIGAGWFGLKRWRLRRLRRRESASAG